jgi:hypothetical protein
MHILDRYTSPDGQLTLAVAIGDDGDVAVGFEGGDWHTHPDALSAWLEVPEDQAVGRFVALVRSDQLLVVTSTDGGQTTDPWISDNLSATVRMFGKEHCVLRYWSGKRAKE